MKKKNAFSLIMFVTLVVFATGAFSAYAKEMNSSFVNFDVDVASPGDPEEKDKTEEASEDTTEASSKKEKTTEEKEGKKKKQKKTKETTSASTEETTEPVTVDIPLDYISAAELAAITSEYSQTLKEKVELTQKLNDIMDSQNSFIARLNELDDMIIDYQNKIDDIKTKTDMINETIAVIEGDLVAAQIQQDAQYEKLKASIAEEYENGSLTYMDALFKATDYSDIVNKTEYIQAVDTYNNNVLGELADSKRRLNDRQMVLQMVKDDMALLEEAYINKQESLEILSAEKERQIKKYDESIARVKAELESVEALEAQQAAKIAQLEASYNVSFSVGGVTSEYEYKGEAFLWPMPTSAVITSYFGPRVAPTAGATSYHRGIDIACPQGSSVIAAVQGVVIYTGYLGTAGNAVVIDHGSGLSTCYYHLSAFVKSVGDKVSAGDIIALSGNTGVSTGPHLHFAVRENGEYVNPLKYFTKITDKGSVSNEEGGN